MKKRRKWFGLILSILLIVNAFLPPFVSGIAHAEESTSVADHVVISEVYGGGGNAGAPYLNDFIELYNPTDKDIDLKDWSVQYASATNKGTFSGLQVLTGTIKAHGYYLIQAAGGANGVTLPTADDTTTSSFNLSGANGQVALVNGKTAISSIGDPAVIDFVGFGSKAEQFLGSGPTPAPSNTDSVERLANDGTNPTKEGVGKGNGWNTKDNAKDFVQVKPNPQNSASPIEDGSGTGEVPPAEPEVPADPTEVTKLGDLRKLQNENGVPTNQNTKYLVEGVVTVDDQILDNSKSSFYIQDETGGINVFGYTGNVQVKKGDKVRVIGQILPYNGLTELVSPTIEIIGESDVPTPVEMEIADLASYEKAEPLEGTLVKVKGNISSLPTALPANVTLSDEDGKSITLRIMAKTQITLGTDIKEGGYEVTGILGQYASKSPYTSGYQIYPRNKEDLTVYYPLTLKHTALEQAYAETDVMISAQIAGADSADLYYKASTATDYQKAELVKGAEQQYSYTIPASDVPQAGFDYYIEVKNQSGTKTSGTADKPYRVTLVKDEAGPVISDESPVDQSKTESKQPTISVQLNDPSGINEASVQMTIDGKAVKGLYNKEAFQYTPDKELSLGEHKIKVTAADKKGNKSEYDWSFTITKIFTGGNHFRGTTHNHTNLSHDAAGTPEEAVKAAIKYGYDYFAFSDHSHDLDAELVGQDTEVRDGMQERKGGDDWKLTKEVAKQYSKDNFTVFPAFEMTSTSWGHSNVFGTENFIDRNINGKQYQTLSQYYAWILTYDDIVAQFNHPEMSANAFNNFTPYDQNVDKLFTMFEVGNGSGHYSYANAEKKYFTALDLGWHIAPTYGEDNHDQSWGKTMRRTVIVADENTNDSLLYAMSKMRVYMTEDPNFTLDMLANGRYMGSVVEGDTLKFDITGSDNVAEKNSIAEYDYLAADYVSNDNIEKVELITNGGKVIDTYMPTGESFKWNPEVDIKGGQQWFLVKVTQKDGEQVYSAPIWSEEKEVDVRISGAELADGVAITGNPTTLSAGISNLGTEELTGLTVKFYADEVKDSNLIGTAPIAKLAGKTATTVSAVWTAQTSGEHKIIVIVDTPEGDNAEDNQYVLNVKVKDALGKTVLIDAAHKNENTSTDSGTYKDNFKAFTKLIQNEGFTVTENKNPLTAEVLKDVSVLVMTHPASELTAEERAAVKDFVAAGGSVFLAAKSNNSSGSTRSNSLLTDIGSTIRISDDQTNDLSKEGNFWSNPETSPFAIRLHPGLVDNLITDRVATIEYYSGSSLEGVNHKALEKSDTVTILVSGNETTFQKNFKNGTYEYDVDGTDKVGGSKIPFIASEVIGKGKIIVAGSNFANDKQLDESYNPKGNDEMALNSINWLAGRETKVKSIKEARSLADGENAVVEGTVTTAAGTFFDAFYVQDDTGGIMAFNEVPTDADLKLGDRVRIYGHIKTFDNNKEIEFDAFDMDVIKTGKTVPVVPKGVTTKEAGDIESQGLLVKVTGQVVSKYDERSYVINDGSGDILVFTDGYIENQGEKVKVPSLTKGDTFEAVGLTGEFADGKRIRVRDTQELKKLADGPPEAPVMNGEINEQTTKITGTAEVGTIVFVKVGNTIIGQATTDPNGSFTVEFKPQKAGTKLSVLAKLGDLEGVVLTKTVLDQTAPTKPTADKVTDKSTYVAGKAEAESTVTVQAGQSKWVGLSDENGDFSIKITTQKAGTVLSITATDQAGNSSEVMSVTVVDETAPTKPIVNKVTDISTSVTGKAEAESTVTIQAGQSKWVGQANKNGDFSIKITTQKAGTVISITATDQAGNTSAVTTVSVTDGTAPTKPTVDKVTDKSTYVTGKAEVGSTVTVMAGKTKWVGTADTNGKFSIKITTQKAGTVVSVTAMDQAKNTSTVTKITVIDVTAPAKPSVNRVTDQSTAVTGKAEAGSTVTVKAGKTKWVGKADKYGKFSIKIAKQKAKMVISVTATDLAKNISPEMKITVADVTGPAKPKLKTTITNNTTKLEGTAEVGSTVSVKAGKKTWTTKADNKGKFKLSISKQKAGTKVTIWATDAAKNKSQSLTITVKDKIAPAAPKLYPVWSFQRQLSGMAEPGATVTVKYKNRVIAVTKANTRGYFKARINYKRGVVLTVTATDAAKNTGKATSVRLK